MYSTKTITRLGDLEDVNTFLHRRFNGELMFWRGHSDASWSLLPSVFRPEHLGKEQAYTGHFIAKAKARHHPCPPRDDKLGWLYLMQHFGLPTRLLDWSENALVALFFAVCDKNFDAYDGCIWTLSAAQLNQRTMKQATLIQHEDPMIAEFVKAAFDDRRSAQTSPTFALATEQDNLRMLLQQAAFTFHGDQTPLENIPDADKVVTKLLIPKTAKESIRWHLTVMGFYRWNLFPDLSTLSKELTTQKFM